MPQNNEITNDVYIKRDDLNTYRIFYKNEEVRVALNLKEDESYETPYELGFFELKKSYFSIIHSGQGDGWNINNPSMSSVVMFQGKIYLIDARIAVTQGSCKLKKSEFLKTSSLK